MDITTLYGHLKAAVEAEIITQQADRANLRSLRAIWAERIRQLEECQAVYRFETAKQVHPSLEDAPVVIDTGEAEVAGEVTFALGYEVHVVTADLGESLGACQLLIDLTFILERLHHLLEEQIRSPRHFEIATAEAVFALREITGIVAGEEAVSLLRCMSSESVSERERPNHEQRAAIQLALNAPVLFLWGPPGTGKTTTLAWIAEACVRRGESVLLVSNTNVAVDRALTKLLDAIGSDGEWARKVAQGAILRLGVSELERLQPLLIGTHLETRGRVEASAERESKGEYGSQRERRRLIENAQLIACTLAKAATDPYLRERRFDLLLIDEGSMAPLPYVAALSALCRKRVVIGGDFRQLPPISLVQEGDEAQWLHTDIFQQAGVVSSDGSVRHRPNLVALAEQWRMRSPICDLVNEPMYEGMLRTPERLYAKPDECLYLVDTAPLRACSDRTSGYSHFNVASALACVGLTQQLLTENPFLRVGIVTPYNAQASLIHAMLLDCDLAHEVRVATVHRFQGEERQAIIFDCVDAPPFGWVGQFLRGSSPGEESTRLLNVAITRAQRQLYVVGDAGYLERKLPPQALLRSILQRIRSEGTVVDGSRFVGVAMDNNRSWRWVVEDEFVQMLQQDLREAMRGRGTVTVMEALLRRDDAETLILLLSDLLRAGVEVNVLHAEHSNLHERVAALHKAGARLIPLRLPQGRQEFQDWCVFIGRQVVWWGSIVMPYRGAAFLRVASRATMNELQFLRRPRSGG
ncbi:MAG: DEAD/DEAH box helicase [Armatimonadota bacterium]|nr:DEAD/DEAH box helicase [Armatimonadota bacterium]